MVEVTVTVPFLWDPLFPGLVAEVSADEFELSIASWMPMPRPGNGRFGHGLPWSWNPSPLTPQLFLYP